MMLVLVLAVLAAAEVPLALRLVQPLGRWRAPSIRNYIGPEAALQPLPARPPHDRPWPPARQWEMDGSFGRRRIGTWHVDAAGQTTHQMVVEYFGWPLPVLRQAQFWWPQNDPAWVPSRPTESGLEVYWPGFVLNPLVFGVPFWVLMMSPLWARAWVRRRRRKGARCPGCGYPVGGGPRCTECGEELPASAVAVGKAAP